MAQYLPPDDLAGMIDKILETRDPATVGLRKILKEKKDADHDFPMKTLAPEDFTQNAAGATGRVFTDDEKSIMELEREILRAKAEVERTRKEADVREKTAHDRGLAEGKEQGLREGRAKASAEYQGQMNNVLDRLASYLNAVEKGRRTLLAQSYDDIISMTRLIARRIVQAELTTNPASITATVKKALTYVADRSRLKIRVAPGDLEAVSARTDFWSSVNEKLENVSVEADDRLSAGGCVIESVSGIVDARIEIQFQSIDTLIDHLWAETRSAPDFPPETQEDLSMSFFPRLGNPDGQGQP